MFRRKIEYTAKLYLVSEVPDMTTALYSDLHNLIYRRGATFSGGSSHQSESDGWVFINARYRTSSPDEARLIFDQWIDNTAARNDLALTGFAFGSIETGWQVWEVLDEDESREEEHTREWMREHYPKGYRELYGG